MRWRFIFHVVGVLVFYLGVAMFVPLFFGFYYNDNSIIPLTKSIVLTMGSGLLLYLFTRGATTEVMSQRDGMAIVALGWTIAGILGALPFFFCPSGFSFTDAFFESVSGFTTTGASILTNIESLSKGLLMWRSFIQWLGGMGIIVLSIAILPFLGVGGMQLYKAEVPSPVPDKLKPRIRDTAMILWKVYVLFTLIETLLLMLAGMNFYDAFSHALTTMPTGGFSTKNASVAHFDSVYMDIIIIIFMIIAGINFSLHYQLLKGKPMALLKDSECLFFIGTVGVLTLLVTIDVYGIIFENIGQALRHSTFQVVSIVTTTGYATFDYEKWPAMSQLILLLCMFLGASAGSTGGGMKCLRVMLCFKYCYKELFLLVHPRAVVHVKIGGKMVPEDVMRSVLGFLSLYVGLYGLATVILAGMGVDFVTSIGAVAATLGNIGPGFGQVGPVENYAQIPNMGKWILSWCMLLGRLEIYTLIIFLVPEFWRK
jgi:trk system potassium uptake protein TrkH